MKTNKKVLIVAAALLIGTTGIKSFATDTGPKPQFISNTVITESSEVRAEKLKEIMRTLE